MNYSQFLFNQLLRAYNKSFDKLPYDIMYTAHNTLYEDFIQSDFNLDESISEYEAIEKFFESIDVSELMFPERVIFK